MKTVSEVIVERLLKYMNEKNLSQYKLAELSGVPYPTIKSIMQKRTKDISLKTVILLAHGLEISASMLIEGEDFNVDNLIID